MTDREMLIELLDEYIMAVYQGAGTDPESESFDHMFIGCWQDAPDMIKKVRAHLG